ncbi:MAG: hypothetical protein JWN23_2446 [Rhodocyclales bacterium]|nr:hypothetical protein [Rhodocyclales bacterium]
MKLLTGNCMNHRVFQRIALLCAALGFSMAALADTAPPPPKLEPIEEPRAAAIDASAPTAKPESEVTVRKRGEEKVEEFRLKGRLYMIKVYPVIGPPYTLVDDHGDGVFNRYDPRGIPNKNAQWNVLSW